MAPGARARLVTVTDTGGNTVDLDLALVPMFTLATPVRSTPVTVAEVPPEPLPDAGDTDSTGAIPPRRSYLAIPVDGNHT